MRTPAISLKAIGAFAALSLPALMAIAADKEPVSFFHKDWELACDNTRTCRAAGYQSDDGDSQPVSLLITRAAGPGAAIEMSLQVGSDKDEEIKGPLRLRVGKTAIANLKGETAQFQPEQVRAVLPELLKSDEAQVTVKGMRWTLSLAGLNAVLLKMDEAQGRVGTPGALARRGSKSESSVLPPAPLPVVKAASSAPARPGDDALAARIFPSMALDNAQDECNSYGEKPSAKSLTVHRLTDKRVLLSLPCVMGAYNGTDLLWIANDKPPYAPAAIDANGEFDPSDMSVTSAMKGRGIGDCGSSETWHFDGRDFVSTGKAQTGMCKGFAGGAWNLPSYVTRVVTPSSKPVASQKP